MKLNTAVNENKNLTVVNMFSGPCAGKSTLKADTFSLMKKQHHKVEEVSEFAKDLVWDQRHNMFIEQDVILATQYWRLRRLVLNGVKYAITDTSLMLGAIYTPPDYFPTFYPHMRALYDSFTNVNIFVVRGQFDYQQEGRNETEQQALEKDMETIDKIIIPYQLPFCIIKSGSPDADATLASFITNPEIYQACLLNPWAISRQEIIDRLDMPQFKITTKDEPQKEICLSNLEIF